MNPNRLKAELPAAARQFILAWAVMLVVGFALGVNVSMRYLLPAAPLMAIWVADLLAEMENQPLFFSLRRLLLFMLSLLVLLVLVAGILNAQWEVMPVSVLAVGLFFAAVSLLGWGALRRGWFSPAAGLALALLLAFPLLFFAVNRVLLPDPAAQMAAVLRSTKLVPLKPLLFVGRPALAGNLRVFLGRDWKLVRADKFNPDRATDYAAILLPEADAAVLEQRGFVLLPAAVIGGAPSAGEWWPALRQRHLPETLERHGRIYMLAIPGS